MVTIHSERADHAWWVLLLLRLLALGMVLLFAWMYWYQLPGWPGLLFASLLTAWALLGFQEMRYELTDEAVVAWFWPFKTTVRYADIEKVEIVRAPWWVGIGCHWARGAWWYLGRYGQCVLVTAHGKGVAMTPKEPERLAKLLRERKKSLKRG